MTQPPLAGFLQYHRSPSGVMGIPYESYMLRHLTCGGKEYWLSLVSKAEKLLFAVWFSLKGQKAQVLFWARKEEIEELRSGAQASAPPPPTLSFPPWGPPCLFSTFLLLSLLGHRLSHTRVETAICPSLASEKLRCGCCGVWARRDKRCESGLSSKAVSSPSFNIISELMTGSASFSPQDMQSSYFW